MGQQRQPGAIHAQGLDPTTARATVRKCREQGVYHQSRLTTFNDLRGSAMSDSNVPTLVPPPNVNDAFVVAGGYLARFGATTRRSYASDLKAWFG